MSHIPPPPRTLKPRSSQNSKLEIEKFKVWCDQMQRSFTVSDILVLISIAILSWLGWFSRRYHDGKGKKIPQPAGLPIVGNLFQVRQPNPWIQMAKWTKEFGPIYRLKMGRSDLIVLGSPKIAVELLEQRSSKYSSRPRNIMTSEYVSKGLRLTFMPYNDLWRRQRKLLHLLTQPKAASAYQPIQSQESAQLCLDLLRFPNHHWNHFQRYAGSTVLQIAFNRRALSIRDPAITKMRECNSKMIETAVPGRYLIDSMPILRYLPQIISPWKRYGNQLFDQTLTLFSELYREVSEKLHLQPLDHSDSSPDACFVARIESLKESYQLSDDQAIFLAGAMFGAGSDTTADAIETFIFACAANPEKVANAQEELDRVIGRDRLPEFSDEDDLIYCGAMVRELLRWRTVIPGGLAHMTTEDDEYEGHFIPKGTTIVANHWSIHLDEKTYKDPEKFIPERFIDPQSGQLIGTKWSTYGHHAFGFGRRICPALHIANKSLFITFTRILWSFNIKIKESNLMSPEEFIKSIKFSTGFSSHPIDLNKSGSIEIIPRDPFSTLKTLVEAVENNGLDPIKLS
ncbi:hypothetical protein MJO28_003457 [Puccinia striiformis f. sp. tritici]|uniref:Cytochrome P450 n=2 Tax=Puccinia striiformis f. sp. tritici TaxID=168172 RepID=A0A0L0UTP5_9BASI|nr:hypothetical protein Pst134EB_005704 [Puccinia striiformis f. sp. tritici]KAI7959666.1 hypothetical protein MJO28_003457 [Puccinia striiformis f. sp. tritici]KNE90094.1 hypothetical protein PSTG_16435 [Puccinia striiformis f. sp. tritici PST-78]